MVTVVRTSYLMCTIRLLNPLSTLWEILGLVNIPYLCSHLYVTAVYRPIKFMIFMSFLNVFVLNCAEHPDITAYTLLFLSSVWIFLLTSTVVLSLLMDIVQSPTHLLLFGATSVWSSNPLFMSRHRTSKICWTCKYNPSWRRSPNTLPWRSIYVQQKKRPVGSLLPSAILWLPKDCVVMHLEHPTWYLLRSTMHRIRGCWLN